MKTQRESQPPAIKSLYVHVPYCSSRCGYCDFYSTQLPKKFAFDSGSPCISVDRYLDAIRRHLASLYDPGNQEQHFLDTVYVGGGTPSAIGKQNLGLLLSMIAPMLKGDARGASPYEWTVECNPDDLDREYLDLLHDLGVNRLSIGIQSLEDASRVAIGRRGSAADILEAVRLVSDFWQGPWSADFMYGLPNQSPEGLARDLAKTSELGVSHISLYELTLEPGTVLDQAVAGKRIRLPDEDESAAQYEAAKAVLDSAGLRRYEVSNWAKPGQECRHNLCYWRLGNWSALGPAAVGNYNTGPRCIRTHNIRDLGRYCDDPLSSMEHEIVETKDSMFECLMLALRTVEGFSFNQFFSRFGFKAEDVFGNLPEEFPKYIHLSEERWKPSDIGLDMLNRVLLLALEKADQFQNAKCDSEFPVKGIVRA